MPSRVLICRSNPVDPDPRVEKIARALRDSGREVRVLAWDHSGTRPPARESGGIEILHTGPVLRARRGLGNLPALAGWQAALLGRLIRLRGSYDLIHACDLDTLLPALVARALFHKQVIYDIFDFYADMLRATPAPVVRMVRAVEIAGLSRADGVILADDSRREQIRGSRPRRLAVVYNSPEEQPAPPPPASPPGSLRIAYAGNLQAERGLFDLLEVLRTHPGWRLDLAGFGPEQARAADEAARLPNVTWHGQVPYARALALNAAADALIAVYDPRVPVNRFASPNKVFEAMLLARPVIVAAGTGADRLVEQAGCGLVVPFGDREALARAFESLDQSPSLRGELGRNGRACYEQRFAWGKMRSVLLDLYRQVEEQS